MRKSSLLLCLGFLINVFTLRAQTTEELKATAASFMRSGDHANAVLIYQRLAAGNPTDLQFRKDLALAFYYQGDYKKADEIIKPVIADDRADDQSFLIASNILVRLDEKKDAMSMLKKGLKKYPASGILYSNLGELQFSEKNYDAVKQWETGIRLDPNYSRNYFNAARFYFLTNDKVWSIVYGEIFLNMEPNGPLSAEVKNILVDSYKKYFIDGPTLATRKQTPFEAQYNTTLGKQVGLASTSGITVETLSMIRTRFIVDWFAEKNRPAFALFDLQRKMLQEGLFEAYNQWLFAGVNISAYANWVKTHKEEYDAFVNFHKNRVFKVPAGQYYR